MSRSGTAAASASWAAARVHSSVIRGTSGVGWRSWVGLVCVGPAPQLAEELVCVLAEARGAPAGCHRHAPDAGGRRARQSVAVGKREAGGDVIGGMRSHQKT